uniref:Uncharacterized protein n=1 Tax=Canis lupus familiaris TaxID=9615 RepID=A0A8P0TSI5_CANLF
MAQDLFPMIPGTLLPTLPVLWKAPLLATSGGICCLMISFHSPRGLTQSHLQVRAELHPPSLSPRSAPRVHSRICQCPQRHPSPQVQPLQVDLFSVPAGTQDRGTGTPSHGCGIPARVECFSQVPPDLPATPLPALLSSMLVAGRVEIGGHSLVPSPLPLTSHHHLTASHHQGASRSKGGGDVSQGSLLGFHSLFLCSSLLPLRLDPPHTSVPPVVLRPPGHWAGVERT